MGYGIIRATYSYKPNYKGEMMRSRSFLLVVLPLILGVLVATSALAVTSAMANSDIRDRTAEAGEGKNIHEDFTNPSEGDTLGVNILFENDGVFEITWGSAFTAPVTVNGATVDTFFPEGQLAPHFTHTMSVEAGQTVTVGLQALETGSMLNLWYDYTIAEYKVFLPLVVRQTAPEQCRRFEITDGEAALIHEFWNASEDGNACIEMYFPEGGNLEIINGWAFWSPVTITRFNGESWMVPIKNDPSNVAHVFAVPFEIIVSSGETLIWNVTWAKTGTEIGIGYNK